VTITRDLSIGRLRKSSVFMSDDDQSLSFHALVERPSKPNTTIKVPVNEHQADILLRMARK
jgi:hypothetical protein